MSWYTRALDFLTKPIQRSVYYEIRENNIVPTLGGAISASGKVVNETNAFMLSVVWACVDIISGTIGMLPLQIIEKTIDGRRILRSDHPNWYLVGVKPNQISIAQTFFERLVRNLLIWGNGYAYIERNQLGRPISIRIVHPSRVQPFLDEDGRLWYKVAFKGYKDTVEAQLVSSDDMIHIKGLGDNELEGWSVLKYARESMGLGIATQEYGNAFFNSGGRPKHVIIHPGELSDVAKTNMESSWVNKDDNGVAILEEGVELQQLDIPPNDAQFLQTRMFTIKDISRYFLQIPHSMIGEDSKSTYSNIEKQELFFKKYSLARLAHKVQQEFTVKIFREIDESNLECSFDMSVIDRVDMKTQWEAWRTAVGTGVMNRDEVRAKMNMNPIDDGTGKLYTIQSGMIPLDQLSDFWESKNNKENGQAQQAAS